MTLRPTDRPTDRSPNTRHRFASSPGDLFASPQSECDCWALVRQISPRYAPLIWAWIRPLRDSSHDRRMVNNTFPPVQTATDRSVSSIIAAQLTRSSITWSFRKLSGNALTLRGWNWKRLFMRFLSSDL